MGEPTNTRRDESLEEIDQARKRVYEALSDARCRRVLSALDRDGATSAETLAVTVSADARDVAPDAVSDADVESVLVELYHTHLPRLEVAGLVSRDEDGTVRAHLDGHEAVPDVRAFLDTDRRHAAASLAHLAVPERRAALAVLAGANEPTDLSTLAAEMRRLHGFDSGVGSGDLLPIALHHVHLPRLEATGFVRYDPDANVVEPRLPVAADELAGETE
jgi:DNA-binding transcriptional ArsR family regulator